MEIGIEGKGLEKLKDSDLNLLLSQLGTHLENLTQLEWHPLEESIIYSNCQVSRKRIFTSLERGFFCYKITSDNYCLLAILEHFPLDESSNEPVPSNVMVFDHT